MKKTIIRILTGIMALIFVFACTACEKPDFDKTADIDKIEQERSDWDIILKRDDENTDVSTEDTEEEIVLGDTDNILKFLIIGVDSREDDFSGRSDTMILVTVNKDTKKILFTSLLRDIYVDIPGHDSNRLNAANVYGGPDLLKKTINENFGIEVDSSITLNFCSVRDIVDYVGGIELDLTADEIEIMNGYIISQNDNFGYAPDTDLMTAADGTYTLNGNQTLAYCRIRYIGTDFMRVKRQQKVIMKCIEKAKAGGITGMAKFAKILYEKVDTDMAVSDMLPILSSFSDVTEYDIEGFTIPMDGTWQDANIDGMAVLSIDFKKNAEEWYSRVTE